MGRSGKFFAALCLFLGGHLHAALPPTVLDATAFFNCDQPSRLAVDKDGSRYVAVTYAQFAYLGGGGFDYLRSAGAHDVAIAKFNSEGRLIWVRRGGGPREDKVAGIAVGLDGRVCVLGTFEGTASFDTTTLVSRGSADIFVLVYTTDGTLEWAQNLGGAGSDTAGGVTAYSKNAFYVCGGVGDDAVLSADGSKVIKVDPRVKASRGSQAFAASVAYNAVTGKFVVDRVLTWPSAGEEYARAVAAVPYASIFRVAVAIDQRTDDRASVVIVTPGKPDVRVVAQTGSTAEQLASVNGAVYLGGMFSRAAKELRVAGLTVLRRSDNLYSGYVARLAPDGTGVWAMEVAGSTGDGYATLGSLGPHPAGGVLLGGNYGGDLYVGGERIPGEEGAASGIAVVHVLESGALDWAKKMPTPSISPVLQARADGSGNILVLGSFEDSVQLGDVSLVTPAGSDPRFNNYLAVLRTTPEFAWARRNGDGMAWGSEVATDLNGNRFVAGAFGPATAVFGDITVTNRGEYDGFVAKYDASGHALWVRTIEGVGQQGASSVAADASGNCYVVGFFEGTTTIGDNVFDEIKGPDGFLAKYSPKGDVLWAREINGSWSRNLRRVRVDRGGSVYVAGTFGQTIDFGTASLTSVGFTDAFLARYSPTGTLQWVRRGGGSGATDATGLAVDAAGNCVLTGSLEYEATFGLFDLAAGSSEDVFVVKYDNAGNVKWARTAGGPGNEVAASAVLGSGGDIYLAGSYSARIQFGEEFAESSASMATFVAKLDRDGNALWVRSAGSTGKESQGLGIAVRDSGLSQSVYVCGLYDTTFEAGLWQFESLGGWDAFLLRYDTDGKLQWAKSAGSEGYDLAASVAVDATGTWTMTGRYADDATFDQQVLHGTSGSRFFLTSSTPITNPRKLLPGTGEAGLGGEFKVPIRLDGRCDEAGLSFSLTFDPAVLQFVNCEKGPEAEGFVLLLNQSQLAEGRLGVGLARTDVNRSMCGQDGVVVVTFRLPANSQARETTLGFGDEPVARRASSATGEDLPVDCLPRTLQIVRGYEADVVEPFKKVTVADMSRIGSFAMGTEGITDRDTLERADCAPFAVDGTPLLGDGEVNLNDWVQASRFVLGLDPMTVQGGPTRSFGLHAEHNARRDAARLPAPAVGPRTLQLLADGWKVGVTNEVVIQFQAAGGENAISLSLAFDPGLLRYVDAALDGTAQGTTLMFNPNNAEQGQLGVLLFLPIGGVFSAGSHDLLRVRFAVSSDAVGMSTQLLFGDSPAPRDVAGGNGVSLATEYSNVSLDFSATPLRITQAWLEHGELRLLTEGTTGKAVVFQRSTDMKAWENVATNATGMGAVIIPWSVTDPVRYIRAMVP